jgi:hypothetical protein
MPICSVGIERAVAINFGARMASGFPGVAFSAVRSQAGDGSVSKQQSIDLFPQCS